MAYNLGVLNDKEFEDLAKDLLELELKVKFENFKIGKDNGIDLRYSNTEKNEIIVQAKHYIRSKFSDLKFQLGKEKEKLDKMICKPKRYILFTSLPLNPHQTDELELILQPYIINTGDIYNRDSIESLISKHNRVERKFHKLWLASSNVLSQIVHNAQTSCSEFMESKIMLRSKLYVETKHLPEAHDFIVKNKVLIITGEPGVGKTTLAYMLIYKFLGEGFELIFSDRSIKDAEEQMSRDNEKKQIILIDDFLGSNLTDIRSTPNNDNIIIRFFDQIKSSENRFLVLTTRTTILNEANLYYESFQREALKKTASYELKVREYEKYEKALILYNHLYHSDLTAEYREFFFIDKNYSKIIDHPNYYPRIIETLTSENLYSHSGYKTVEDYIFKNLENPSKIWEYAFENQIGRLEQLLIETVFTFGDKGVELSMLENAFNLRYELENKTSRCPFDIDPFNNSLKKLLESFLKIEITGKNFCRINFVNPSVTDFLLEYLRINDRERKQIWNSVKYLEQYENRFGAKDTKYLRFRDFEESEYLEAFLKNLKSLRSVNPNDEVSLRILHFMTMMFTDSLDNITDQIIAFFEHMHLENVDNRRVYEVLKVIKNTNCIRLQEYIALNWDVIIELMVTESYEPADIGSVALLHEEYNISFNDYLIESNMREELSQIISENFWELFKDQDLSSSLEYDYEGDLDYGSTEIQLKWEAKRRFEQFLEEEELSDYFDFEDLFSGINYDTIISKIYEDSHYSPDIYDKEYGSGTGRSSDDGINIDEKIDKLFER